MQHRRFDVALLAVDRRPIPLKAAYLLAVRRDGADLLDWECLAYGLEAGELPRGRYRVDITTLDGRVLVGEAIVVRSQEGSHVLRGDGPLDGLAADDVAGDVADGLAP